jgi:diguanylate cyclase (GGDEF)-like protein
VLPETGYEKALDAARKLRSGVAHQPFDVHGKQAAITASFGLCGLDRVPTGGRRIPEHMLKVADAALYQSKHAGRNRVTATMLHDEPDAPPAAARSGAAAKTRAD